MKRTKPNEHGRTAPAQPAALPDDFPAELVGQFAKLPPVAIGNLGAICGAAVSNGGYFGFSVTDDGGSAKLAIRCALLSFDKRVYSLTDLETLLAYCARKFGVI